MNLFSLSLCLVLLAISSANCCGEVAVSTQNQLGKAAAGEVSDYGSFIDKLRAAGMSIGAAGEVEQPFLSVTGKMIRLYSEDVQVFEYPSVAEMEAQAKLISRDGMAVGPRKIFWVGSPHFYKHERLLVLYVGENEKVLGMLAAVLGHQFAGR